MYGGSDLQMLGSKWLCMCACVEGDNPPPLIPFFSKGAGGQKVLSHPAIQSRVFLVAKLDFQKESWDPRNTRRTLEVIQSNPCLRAEIPIQSIPDRRLFSLCLSTSDERCLVPSLGERFPRRINLHVRHWCLKSQSFSTLSG